MLKFDFNCTTGGRHKLIPGKNEATVVMFKVIEKDGKHNDSHYKYWIFHDCFTDHIPIIAGKIQKITKVIQCYFRQDWSGSRFAIGLSLKRSSYMGQSMLDNSKFWEALTFLMEDFF